MLYALLIFVTDTTIKSNINNVSYYDNNNNIYLKSNIQCT